MVYIPNDTKWYVAEIVEEIRVEHDPENVVHRNLVLIRADSPEEAYEKAIELGREGDREYDNPEARRVRFRFRGLSELCVIYDELEHGAELLFSEDVGVSEEQIASWVRPKEALAVFRPDEPRTGPDYSSREIVREAEELIRKSSPERG
ncbi:MAG: DUF4288 domain-containing protein [Terriglobales bacterium]